MIGQRNKFSRVAEILKTWLHMTLSNLPLLTLLEWLAVEQII